VQGFPNCNYLKDKTGINVQGSTLLTHGLQVSRADVLAKSESPKDPPPSDIKEPGAPPAALDTAATARPAPFEGETWNSETTLHRNKKAMETLSRNIRENRDILSRMTKKSGQASEYEGVAKEFEKELDRILAKL